MTRIQVQAGTTLLSISADFSDSGTLASLTVADTGNGMNMNTASREFARNAYAAYLPELTDEDGADDGDEPTELPA